MLNFTFLLSTVSAGLRDVSCGVGGFNLKFCCQGHKLGALEG